MMDKDLGVDAIYVIHAKVGYEAQGAYVTTLFAAEQLDFEWMQAGDISNFTPELLAENLDPAIFTHLRQGSVSLTLNHILCLRAIMDHEYKLALIFEDDPCFLGDFKTQLKKVTTEAALLPPGFIISLENTTLAFPSKKGLKRNQLLYSAMESRCAGAYLVDLEGAKAMLKHLENEKCNLISDWWFNRLIDLGVIKMYWAHPALVEQGSHNGRMSAAISTRQSNKIRQIRWFFKKQYKIFLWHLGR